MLELSRWADYVVLWQPIPRQLDRLVRRGGYHPILERGDLTVLAHARTRPAATGGD